MNFANEYELNWIVGKLATVGKKTVDLLPFEFGVVDSNTHQISGTVPDEGYFVVGSPNKGQATDGQRINRQSNALSSNVSFKSESLGEVKRIQITAPDKQDLTQVYYLGYNGLDDCGSLDFQCGETYQFHVNVKGQEVLNIFGRYEFNEIVSVQAPCCDESCGCVDGKVDCSLVIDDLLNRFDTDLFWVKRFFHVEKVMDCSPAETAPTKLNFTTYCLTLCDAGDELALAKVQNQYPSVKVEVKEKKKPFTTYQFTQLATLAAPAAFTSQDTVVKGCDACPSGFTLVPSRFSYLVEIDNANADVLPAAQLAAVQAVWPTVTFASKNHFDYGVSTYYVESSAALSGTTQDARIVRALGMTENKCQQTTPITTAWASCGTSYKITRDLCLTMKNDDCKTNPEELAEIVAYYASNPEVVPGSLVLDGSSTDCLIRFNVSQYNNSLLEDGCDTYGFDGAKFNNLPSYKGFQWEVCPCEGWTVNGNGCPVPPAADDKCCKCGLKFTTKQWEELYPECAFDINQYQVKDPIDLSVTAYYKDGTPMVCGLKTPTFRKVKGATYQSLKGRDVIREVIATRSDLREQYYNLTSSEQMLLMERQGFKYGVKFDDYYYKVSITHLPYRPENHPTFVRKETVSLYVHEDNILLVEALVANLSGMFPKAKVERI